MKDMHKMQAEETVWYENYEPVREYLDRPDLKKPTAVEKGPKTGRFSWLDIMKKSFHFK